MRAGRTRSSKPSVSLAPRLTLPEVLKRARREKRLARKIANETKLAKEAAAAADGGVSKKKDGVKPAAVVSPKLKKLRGKYFKNTTIE